MFERALVVLNRVEVREAFARVRTRPPPRRSCATANPLRNGARVSVRFTRSGARKRRNDARQKSNGSKVARRLYLYERSASSPAPERVPGFNDTGLRVSFGCALADINNWQPTCETTAAAAVTFACRRWRSRCTSPRGSSSLVSRYFASVVPKTKFVSFRLLHPRVCAAEDGRGGRARSSTKSGRGKKKKKNEKQINNRSGEPVRPALALFGVTASLLSYTYTEKKKNRTFRISYGRRNTCFVVRFVDGSGEIIALTACRLTVFSFC